MKTKYIFLLIIILCNLFELYLIYYSIILDKYLIAGFLIAANLYFNYKYFKNEN